MSEQNTEATTEMDASAVDSAQEVPATEQTLEEKIEALADQPAQEEAAIDAKATEGETGEVVDAAEAEGAELKYQPNFGFKVKDKEYEIDEWARSLITDEESEKKVKELFEKAYGLDHVKANRDEIREERNGFKSTLEQQNGLLYDWQYMIDQKDFSALFKAVEINPRDIMMWALKQAELQEAGPDARAAYEQDWQVKRQNRILDQQYSLQQQQLEQMQRDQVTNEYNYLVSTPDISTYKEAFDQRNGANAFANEVALRGEAYERAGNANISVKEVIDEVMKRFPMASAEPAQDATPASSQQQTAPSMPKEVPVIPSTGSGGSSSPAQKEFKSLDELKAFANKF